MNNLENKIIDLDTLGLKISMNAFKKYLGVNENRRFGYSMKEDQKKHVTEIIKVDADWVDVKNKCRNTVNKEYSDKLATTDFKKKVLISEHSPIRIVKIEWRWKSIKSWIATHFARHWLGWDKWISTQREDRTGVDRDKAPQDAPVNYDGSSNAQACINVGRYRLCVGCAHEQTRYCMEDLKDSIHPYEPELSDVMVPNCIYRGGCPEFHECGYFRKFIKWCKENDKDVDFFNIQNRYDAYNEFYKTGIGR